MGNDRKIRLGIIGCGAIAEGAHLPAVLASPLVELTAVSDVHEPRVRNLERQYALGPIGCTDFRQVFERVDAVILALPNAVHAPVGLEFLSRGIHVLCEKPLAISETESEQLTRAARESSAVLAVGYVTRFFPSTQLTKQLLEEEFLGLVEAFDYEFGTDGGWATLSGYNLRRASSGGGVLAVSGSHFVDRMLYFFESVNLLSYEDDSRGGVEANCRATVSATLHGRACSGTIAVSKTHRLRNRLRIAGEKGTLEVGEGQTKSVFHYPRGSQVRHEIFFGDAAAGQPDDYFRMQVEDFARAILTKGRPMVDGEQGAASVRFIEECYRNVRPIEEPWCDNTLARLAGYGKQVGAELAPRESILTAELETK